MNPLKLYAGLRREIYVLFIGRIVTNMGAMVWSIITLVMSQKLGMNATTVAYTMISVGFIFIPASLIGGKLADRFNKKKVIIYCDIVSIVLYITTAFLPLSFNSIIILMIAASFQNMEHPAYNALIADLSTSSDRERAYSLSYLGTNIGMIASPTIAGLLFENHLWLCFLLSGLSIALSTILIIFLVKDITPCLDDALQVDEYQAGDDKSSLLGILLSNKLVLVYIIAYSFYVASYSQFGFIIPLDLGRIFGDRGAVIYGAMSSVNCITVVVCTPIMTRLFVKASHMKEFFLGDLCLLTAYLLMVALVGKIPFYYIGIIILTFGEILNSLSNGPYITLRIPASHRGRINGFMNIVQSMLSGLAMWIIGILYDDVSPLSGWIFTIALIVIASLTALVLTVLDKKRYQALY